MPTYVYECAKCGDEFEVWQSIKDDPLKRHTGGCGGKLAKVIQPAGILLKGSGFYKNDSRNGGKRSSSSGSESKSSESKSESTDSSASKAKESSTSSNGSSGSTTSSDKGSSGGSSSTSSKTPAKTSSG